MRRFWFVLLAGASVFAHPSPATAGEDWPGADRIQETTPSFDPALSFAQKGPYQPNGEPNPDCLPAPEAKSYFREREQGGEATGEPPETIRILRGLDAGRFIPAAWPDRGVLPSGAAYMRVDAIILRTRSDRAGFARVHFASSAVGVVCGFRRAVFITSERMQAGVSGVPRMPPLRQGNSVPGLTEQESDSLRLMYGLRNQLERGTPEERDRAIEGLQRLLVPQGGMGGSGVERPRVDPRYEPSESEMIEGMQPPPLCRDRPYRRDCVLGR